MASWPPSVNTFPSLLSTFVSCITPHPTPFFKLFRLCRRPVSPFLQRRRRRRLQRVQIARFHRCMVTPLSTSGRKLLTTQFIVRLSFPTLSPLFLSIHFFKIFFWREVGQFVETSRLGRKHHTVFSSSSIHSQAVFLSSFQVLVSIVVPFLFPPAQTSFR